MGYQLYETLPRDLPPRKKSKKNAQVICANGNVFWTTQKQFWAWVRDGIVTYRADGPLTGKFEGNREKLTVMVKHILLSNAAPEHKEDVLGSYRHQKPRKPHYAPQPFRKRPR